MMFGMNKPLLKELPYGEQLQRGNGGDGGIVFKFQYINGNDGSLNWTEKLNHVCWGFMYTQENFVAKLGKERTDVKAVTYLMTPSQIKAVGRAELAKDYFKVLHDAGVSQWLTTAPKTLADMAEGCCISCEYPAQMVVGLLEMYRDIRNNPQYCAYVVQLRKEFGCTAGSALILARLLRLNSSNPSADAFTVGIESSRRYKADMFSERHILKCLEVCKHVPLYKKSGFTGVFDFFNSGYSKKVKNEPLRFPCAERYIQSGLCSQAEQERSWRMPELVLARGNTQLPREPLTVDKRVVDSLAKQFNLTYEQCHDT